MGFEADRWYGRGAYAAVDLMAAGSLPMTLRLPREVHAALRSYGVDLAGLRVGRRSRAGRSFVRGFHDGLRLARRLG